MPVNAGVRPLKLLSRVIMDDEYIRPPGTYYDILAHPSGEDEAIEVSLVQDHRFVFFYWMKWVNKLCPESKPPVLVTIDWHQDLSAPEKDECAELNKIDKTNYKFLSHYCWEGLNPLNDGHILSAAYLNIIGDIYVLCKQGDEESDEYIDSFGNIHKIICFEDVNDLVSSLKADNVGEIILDIDLDYFTESSDSCGGGENLELVSDEVVESIISPSSELMQWAFPRIIGGCSKLCVSLVLQRDVFLQSSVKMYGQL